MYKNKILKMKNIYKIILLTVWIFVGQACSNLLEEDLSSVVTIENLNSEGDIVAAIAPIYRTTQDAYGSPHYQRTPTYGADDLTTWWAGNKAPLRVFDGFNYGNGENADVNWLSHGWDNYWKTIYYANTVIEGLKTSTAPDEIVKTADGEARFLRALSYFHLVRTHGNMPIIIDGYSPTGHEQRATVLENYLQIESDLKIAEANLPAPGAVANIGRASSAAAKTLLANLYLTWAGWPVKDESKYAHAATKSKEVIDMNYFALLPIDKLWLQESQNSKESIFSIQFSETEQIPSGWAGAFSFHESRGWSDAYPELRFFYDFPEGARKDATFAVNIPQRIVVNGLVSEKDPPETKPYQKSQRVHPMYKKFTSAEVFNQGDRVQGFRAVEVFRYAEVLLVYAEAQAFIGSNASSIEALNQVKRRAAGLPYLIPNASVDVSSTTVNAVIDERGWELAGEYKRWFDLIRSERVEEIALKRDPKENVPLLSMPTKLQYISPIPYQAIISSDLIQNPEGFKIK